MKQILQIESSPRTSRSHTRYYSQKVVEALAMLHPEVKVAQRDLALNPPLLLNEAWVLGAYTPAETHSAEARDARTQADILLDEFLSAETYVIGSPMHNFGISALLKAYLDQILLPGRTFDSNWKGLVHGKKAIIITARGGVYAPGTPFAAYDHQEPYLRTVLGFIGITDLHFLHIQGLNSPEIGKEAAYADADRQLATIIDHLK